jgi:hypothetical protein
MRGVQAEPVIDLTRERDLSQIFSATLALYRLRPWLFLVLATVIVVPAVAVVDGILLGGFGDESASPVFGQEGGDVWQQVADAVVGWVLPMVVTAAHARAVFELGSGREPTVGGMVAEALRLLPGVLAVSFVYAVAVGLGFLALVVPGVYLGVRLGFATPAYVVDRAGVRTALRESWRVVAGNWGRCFGILLLVYIVAGVASAAVDIPLELLGDALDSGPLIVAGIAVGQTIVLSFTALATTVLFFDLRARHAAAPVADVGAG